MLSVAIPVIFLIRALRPFVLIRFHGLLSNRIGHFAGDTEIYLCQRDQGLLRTRTLDIFYHSSPISNYQLKKMWDRTLHVWQFASLLDIANRLVPGGSLHVVPDVDRDVDGLVGLTPPHIYFTAEEEEKGKKGRRDLGIADGVPYVCFHARDSAYLAASFPETDWQYHEIRNSSIHNYVPAAQELFRRGNATLRMGAVVQEPLGTTSPGVIDYATHHRTDFLDIYLSAKCRFYLCSATGVERLPMVFRRPAVFVNWMPLDYVNTWGEDDLFIPKHLWLRDEQRWLTFKEILETGIGRYLRSAQYQEKGIEIIENTPEEITAVTVEMDERLNGTWQTTEEDEELQRRFWSLYEANDLHRVFRIRIGSEFLRQNQDLLG